VQSFVAAAKEAPPESIFYHFGSELRLELG
jgi:hypothetical protein